MVAMLCAVLSRLPMIYPLPSFRGSRVAQLMLLPLLCTSVSANALAAEAKVAVASSFAAPARIMAREFEQRSGHRLHLSFASTGKLYAQIRHGAPFEVFLAADQHTPASLVEEGLAVAASRFSYAQGRLALWSATPGMVDDKGKVLGSNAFKWLAIANPRFAPYGRAGKEVLIRMGLQQALTQRLVLGENAAQARQFVMSGNAELGLIALSQVMRDGKLGSGSAWLVPQHLHLPILHDAVLLAGGKNNAAAKAWLGWLKGDRARTVMRSFGY